MRLLRVLVTDMGEPMTAGELARRAALARTSIYKSLDLLERAGIVSYIGAGRQRLVRLERAHPLAPAIESLFAAEARSFTEFVDALIEAAGTFPDANAVWLEGPIASGTDRLGESLSCYLLAAPERLPALTAGLRERFAPIERRYDVTIQIHGLTRSELAARSREKVPELLNAILLAGTPPAAFHPVVRERFAGEDRIQSHGDHDARALAIARTFANHVARDPGILQRALKQVEHRLERASPGERHELEEWAHLLRNASPRRFRMLLVDPGERMTRLRQSMPFVKLLASEDRVRLKATAFDSTAE
ncbi:MAG TPA: winged helix-turn-helix domain-containing protein [Gemmatimonadaceae bacterium]|nr:winged helix-turn-helix domain-containing protein [Gemmatimonadaceae bacterium]